MLLVMVDGKTTAAELIRKVSGLGLDDQSLATLESEGYIRRIATIDEPVAPASLSDDGAEYDEEAEDEGEALPEPEDTVMEAAAPAAPIAPAAPAAPAVPERAAPAPVAFAPVASAPAAPASATPPANTPPSAAPAPEDARSAADVERIQAIQHLYSEIIREKLGLRGVTMQLKVERAGTLEEYRALAQPLLDAVKKTKGDEVASAVKKKIQAVFQ